MISIVIVGYNHRKDLDACFRSIYKNTYRDFQIIYVDNNSRDGSLSFVRKKYPQVIALQNRNTGYAGGNNLGIKKTLELKSDFALVLNPDTLLDKNCLTRLVNNAKKNEIVQPLILLYKNGRKTNLVNTTGNHLNYLGISYCDDYLKRADQVSDREITSASGAAMLVPAGLFKKIGCFDERFFMYHEDLDFCWRARIAGFNVRLQTNALVYHKYAFSRNKSKFFFIERNRWLFILKNYQLKTIFAIIPMLALNEFLMFGYALLSGWFLEKLKASGSLLLNMGYVMRARLSLKRTVPDSKLKKFIGSEISFSEVSNPLFIPYNIFLKAYWFLIKSLL